MKVKKDPGLLALKLRSGFRRVAELHTQLQQKNCIQPLLIIWQYIFFALGSDSVFSKQKLVLESEPSGSLICCIVVFGRPFFLCHLWLSAMNFLSTATWTTLTDDTCTTCISRHPWAKLKQQLTAGLAIVRVSFSDVSSVKYFRC